MAERTFRSPGFFDAEIDLSQRVQPPLGTPAGVIGTAAKGPAFVPISVGTFVDFKTKFGNLDSKKFGPYAVSEFLKNRGAATFVRVLGAGSNKTSTQIETTRARGTVTNAGFKLVPITVGHPGAAGASMGAVQFIVADHFLSASETRGMPMFTDNDSFNETATGTGALVVRAMIMPTNNTRIMLLDHSSSFSTPGPSVDLAGVGTSGQMKNRFKIVVSSSAGAAFANDEGFPGIKIYTASLDPDNEFYISNILNTDPESFLLKKHVLYADFAVDNQLASVNTATGSIAVVSGSFKTNKFSTLYTANFGRFDTRYKTPTTTMFISQPFGDKEYDLFRIEAISDGAFANTDLKITVRNVRASANPNDEYGTFSLQIRKFSDTDLNPEVMEEYPELSLNPSVANYVAKVIGDKKAFFNFDAEQEDERRMVTTGKYPNRSSLVRVIVGADLDNGRVPAQALPFGFRGAGLLRTNPLLADNGVLHEMTTGDSAALLSCNAHSRNYGAGSVSGTPLTGAILPPVPFRFKVTRGNVATSPTAIGQAGSTEIVDNRFTWGVKFERNTSPDSPNPTEAPNRCVAAFTKLLGIDKLQVAVSGANVDTFNNNKFTLARVALSSSTFATVDASTTNNLMKAAAYIRNGSVNAAALGTEGVMYTVSDSLSGDNRVTLASLLASGSLSYNRFVNYAKFTNLMHGGFDGFNILDKNAARMNDKAASAAAGGGANTSFTSPGMASNMAGSGRDNSTIAAYKAAADILTDPFASNINLLAIPGIRDPLVTDHVADRTKDYSMAMYVMDIENYDDSQNRLYDDSVARVNVRKTRELFEGRAIDNNYVAVYFPDVVIEGTAGKHVDVPSSVAAYGALGFNDKVGYPWFAPAGFNRASLDFVRNVDARLSKGDRDALYDARINPIATFPRQGFVIFGQKTLQFAKSALDRVNVRRLLLEVKRLIVNIAEGILFEPNTPATRAKFISQATPLLALIQMQAGIESFRVVMDSTNNTQDDIETNRLNGKIVVVPTRAVEFIVVDFIITNSGVSFE